MTVAVPVAHTAVSTLTAVPDKFLTPVAGCAVLIVIIVNSELVCPSIRRGEARGEAIGVRCAAAWAMHDRDVGERWSSHRQVVADLGLGVVLDSGALDGEGCHLGIARHYGDEGMWKCGMGGLLGASKDVWGLKIMG
ncbi:hypothetical protein C7974DRAFT_467888 [Boeremia exigua]|uniref:uncharacterized protein n=1 Tax=Boeremia exigua TaxID=749465 RepID=UPI001E8E5F8C|nr:uncharacterized protein C7974DRAFT_467888 [Boeremia exigua]KAH6644220.1 hypothetical protein C7974DRAFT_467888 [Boeremia exigua]